MGILDNEGHDPKGFGNTPSRRSGVEHFWTPPGPGERILGMTKYQDMIVVATDRGVYVIAPPGRGLMDHEVRMISTETLRALRDGDA